MNYLSVVAIAMLLFYADSGWRILRLDRRAPLNRVAFACCLNLALWAADAALAYSAPDPEAARRLYLLFSPTWNLAFGLALHFCLLASGVLDRTRPVHFLLLYAPGLAYTAATRAWLLEGFSFTGGYWRPELRQDWVYLLFTLYYLGFTALGVGALLRARSRGSTPLARRRHGLLAASVAAPVILGFLSDTVGPRLPVEVPNLGILWSGFWALGLRIAMTRYGLFAPFPLTAARQIVEGMSEAFFYLDERGVIVWANPTAGRAAGARPAELAGRPFADALALEGRDRELALALLAGDLASPVRIDRFGSSRGPAELSARNLHLESEPLAGAIVTARDAAAEEGLADAGRLYEAFLANSLDGIALVDTRGRIEAWSASMERLTGIAVAEARGRYLGSVFEELAFDRAAVSAIGDMATGLFGATASPDTAGTPGAPGSPGEAPDWTRRLTEYRIRDRGGAERWLQTAVFVVPQRGGPAYAAIVREVTDQKRASLATMEEIRRHERSHRMESVGTLAAGLAHDFNNILTGVSGTVSLLRLGIEDGSLREAADLVEGLAVIEESAARATAIARKLLEFSRKGPAKAAPVRLAAAVEAAVSLCRGGLDPQVRLETGPLPSGAVVVADASELERLLVNLILNANDAMGSMRPPGEPRGGLLRVDAEPVLADPPLRALRPECLPGRLWLLRVRDEGVGIPRELLSRVFDPFFTTKGDGKATGLGLSIAESIARRSGGFLEILSERGRGTEVRVYLPAAPEEPES